MCKSKNVIKSLNSPYECKYIIIRHIRKAHGTMHDGRLLTQVNQLAVDVQITVGHAHLIIGVDGVDISANWVPWRTCISETGH